MLHWFAPTYCNFNPAKSSNTVDLLGYFTFKIKDTVQKYPKSQTPHIVAYTWNPNDRPFCGSITTIVTIIGKYTYIYIYLCMIGYIWRFLKRMDRKSTWVSAQNHGPMTAWLGDTPHDSGNLHICVSQLRSYTCILYIYTHTSLSLWFILDITWYNYRNSWGTYLLHLFPCLFL